MHSLDKHVGEGGPRDPGNLLADLDQIGFLGVEKDVELARVRLAAGDPSFGVGLDVDFGDGFGVRVQIVPDRPEERAKGGRER